MTSIEEAATVACVPVGGHCELREVPGSGFDPGPDERSTALDTTFGLLGAQAGRVLGADAQHGAARQLAYALWAVTHGLVSLELMHASRSPLAHPALAETDGQAVLDTALRAALAGWSRAGATT